MFRPYEDPSGHNCNLLFEPCFYAGLGILAVTFATQRFPDYFLDPRYRDRVYFKHPAQRLFLPILSIPILGFYAVNNYLQEGDILRGHFASLCTSAYMALWGIPNFRISYAYPLVGLSYAMFGYGYNYRTIKFYTNDAPWWNSGDITEIVNSCWDKFSSKR